MHVVFIEPAFPVSQREFVRGLHAVGARVTGIGERPAEALGEQLNHWLYAYHQVSNVCNELALARIVAAVHERDPVQRLETTVESVPEMSLDTLLATLRSANAGYWSP